MLLVKNNEPLVPGIVDLRDLEWSEIDAGDFYGLH